jgi:hypothetical protein
LRSWGVSGGFFIACRAIHRCFAAAWSFFRSSIVVGVLLAL